MKKMLFFLFFAPLLFSLVSYQTSFGGGGKIVIKPTANVSWQMDSNFWRSQENEREVYSYLVQPGLIFGYETDKSKIHLIYQLDGYVYSDRDTLSPGERKASDDNYIGQRLTLAASTQIQERLEIGLKEDFYYTRDQAQSDQFNDSVLRAKYYINRVEPFAVYKLSDSFTGEVRYRNTVTNYIDSNFEDSLENRGLFDLAYTLSETSSLDLEYQVWKRSYSKNTSTYLSNEVMIGYDKRFRILSLHAAVGYQHRSFDDETLESISVIPWNVSARLETEKSSYVSIEAKQNFNDQGLSEAYYKAERFTLTAGYTFLERIPVEFWGYYQKSKYEFNYRDFSSSSRRDDDTYRAELKVGYKFLRWFTVSLVPGYQKRDSNEDGLSYVDKTIKAELSFQYDVGGK